MAKSIIGIELTPTLSLEPAFVDAVNTALDRAHRGLNTIDIVLCHDDGSHNYTVLASVVSEHIVGTPCALKVKTWFNEEALAKHGMDVTELKTALNMHEILSVAFNNIGMLHSHAERCGRSAQDQADRAYAYLYSEILKRFQLKEL